MGFYGWEMRKSMECDPEEIRDLIPFVDLFVEIAEKARREGLLSIEDDFDDYPDPMMRVGLEMAVDGTDPEILRLILEKRILAGGKTGAALRRELIILEGVLAVQAGYNPRIVLGLLGVFLVPLIESYKGKPDITDSDLIVEKYLSEIGRRGPVSGNTSLIEILNHLEPRSLQRLLREVDNTILIKAMMGAGSDVIRSIIYNMSSRAGELLLEDMLIMGSVQESEIRECQMEIRQIFEKLIESGDIFLPGDNMDL